jgi:hypothetical protein
MSEPQINLFALRQLFSQDEWTRLTRISAFNDVAQNLQSNDEIKNALRLGLDLLEQQALRPGVPPELRAGQRIELPQEETKRP